MSMCDCVHVCLCTMCVLNAFRDQKTAFQLLEPELQMVVSYAVGFESGVPGTSERAASVLNCITISLGP